MHSLFPKRLVQALPYTAMIGLLVACASDKGALRSEAATSQATTSAYEKCFQERKKFTTSLEAAQFQCRREASRQ